MTYGVVISSTMTKKWAALGIPEDAVGICTGGDRATRVDALGDGKKCGASDPERAICQWGDGGRGERIEKRKTRFLYYDSALHEIRHASTRFCRHKSVAVTITPGHLERLEPGNLGKASTPTTAPTTAQRCSHRRNQLEDPWVIPVT